MGSGWLTHPSGIVIHPHSLEPRNCPLLKWWTGFSIAKQYSCKQHRFSWRWYYINIINFFYFFATGPAAGVHLSQ